jgi:hypothetical protein
MGCGLLKSKEKFMGVAICKKTGVDYQKANRISGGVRLENLNEVNVDEQRHYVYRGVRNAGW